MDTIPVEVLSMIPATPIEYATLRRVCLYTSKIKFTPPMDFYAIIAGHGWKMSMRKWLKETYNVFVLCMVYPPGDFTRPIYTAESTTLGGFLRAIGHPGVLEDNDFCITKTTLIGIAALCGATRCSPALLSGHAAAGAYAHCEGQVCLLIRSGVIIYGTALK